MCVCVWLGVGGGLLMLISHGVREVQNIHIEAEKDYKEALKKNVKEEEREKKMNPDTSRQKINNKNKVERERRRK